MKAKAITQVAGAVVLLATGLAIVLGSRFATPSAAPTTLELSPVGYRETRAQALLIPVRGVQADQLVDTFAQARDNGARPHDAIDIMAPRGAPIIAAAPGTIEKLFVSKVGGLTIYQRSPDLRTLYFYAHLDAYAPGLVEGQTVRAGAAIATVGSSGNANPLAPHLHFEVRAIDPAAKWYQPSVALNPYPLLTR